jgi:hypothetical protein
MRMAMGATFSISASAAAELGRQAAIAGTPGLMHLDLVSGSCEQHVIRLRPGHLAGIAMARATESPFMLRKSSFIS